MGLITIKDKIFPKLKEGIIIYKEEDVHYMNINRKSVDFNKNIKKHGFIFHYNIRSDPFWLLVMLLLEGCHVYVLHV